MRQDLLDTVRDLFLDDDTNALSVEAVARAAGCSKATVYVYFPGDLNELPQAVYDDIFRDVAERAGEDHLRGSV